MPKVSGRTALLLSVTAALVVLLIGWFVLVSPQRSKASSLDTQIAVAEQQLSDAEHLLAPPSKEQSAGALAAAERALPDTPQTSTILRQLSAATAAAQVELDSIGPGPIAATGGAEAYPLGIEVKGRYFAIQKFVRLLRQSADVNGGKITGTGRLYSIDSVNFGGAGAAPSQGGGSVISATLTLNAFVYGPPTTTTTTPSTTTPATTTPTTTTAAAPTG